MTNQNTDKFLGQHWIVECHGPLANQNKSQLERLMRTAALAGGATILTCHMHEFGACNDDTASTNADGAGGQAGRQKVHGVTGVLMLAESHISVHTWPEYRYAAFDIFMCRGSNPQAAYHSIKNACPKTVVAAKRIERGDPERFFGWDDLGGTDS